MGKKPVSKVVNLLTEYKLLSKRAVFLSWRAVNMEKTGFSVQILVI